LPVKVLLNTPAGPPLARPPPTPTAVLRVNVLALTVAELELFRPPPLVPAELAVKVLPLTVAAPLDSTSSPPP
jgi:hypothetical protein